MSIEVVSNDPKEPKPAPAAEAPAQVQDGSEKTAVEAAAPAETPADSEPVETEEPVITDGELDETAIETDPKTGKKKGGFQRRIDKLNARVTAKEQELEYWKQQALKGAGTSHVQAPVEAQKAIDSVGKPKPDDFNTHTEYVEALTDWKTDQKLNERDQKTEKSKLENDRAKEHQSYNERVKAFAEKTEDFQEMLSSLDGVPRSPALESIIVSSENGPELLYELAKNPEEARRIALLPPLAAAREMGKIEAKLIPSSSEVKKPEQKTTKAPAPLAPVRGSGAASIPKNLDEAANQSFSAYKKQREAEIKKRRQA